MICKSKMVVSPLTVSNRKQELSAVTHSREDIVSKILPDIRSCGNYFFPMMYPDWDLGNWYYLRRVFGNVFFDTTAVTGAQSEATLNSYGAEMQFESKFFRIIPMTFGVRVLQRLLDDSVRGEAFLSSSLVF
jgi:hypothetical protein